MREPVRVVLTVMASLTVSAEMALAQHMVSATDGCHRPCSQALAAVATVPVLAQRIAYRDIQRQEYRQQAYWQNVPVTRRRKVAVDRGRYQMVWVPKMVVQDISETHYESRIRYRTVAIPVTQRVAELRPAAVGYLPLPGTSATALALPPVGQTTAGVVLLAPEPWIADTAAHGGVMPTLTIPSSAASQRLTTTRVPDSGGDWQTIRSRSSSGATMSMPRLGGYRTAPIQAPSRRTTHRKPPAAQTRSAANVWRVQRSIH